MGAWGMRAFQDDTALDFFEDQLLSLGQGGNALVETLNEALEAVIKLDGYLDYDLAQPALVAAAVIDAALHRTELEPDEPEEWTAWRQQDLQGVDVEPLRPLAVQALQRVLGEGSEVRDMWKEHSQEDFQAWVDGLEDRIARLKPLTH